MKGLQSCILQRASFPRVPLERQATSALHGAVSVGVGSEPRAVGTEWNLV